MLNPPLDIADLHASLTDPVLESMNFLNEIVSRFPGAISFAPGRPYNGLFDDYQLGEYIDAYTDYLRAERGYSREEVQRTLFQYGRTNGHIHDLIATTVANDEGIQVRPEAVVVTTGCQEGMLLVLRALFARPRDVLLVASPCYIGITGTARLLDVRIVPVAEGERGLEPGALSAAAAAARARGDRPRAVYLVPDFANPSGASLSVAARREILAMAERENLLVLEDNPYGFFLREGVPRPTLKSLDRTNRVIYLGSFAKTCFPGARVGYVLADQEVAGRNGKHSLLADELSKIKSMTTVNTSAISQAVIGGILVRHGCRLREATAAATAFYRANLTALLSELRKQFPESLRSVLGVRWTVPDGGFFVVMDVPFTADEEALEKCARDYGVLWTPMQSFYLDGGGSRRLRLSCSAVHPAEIEEGVRRLAAFVASLWVPKPAQAA